MARAARYGHVPPDVFEEMDWDEGVEVARRTYLMYQEDTKLVLETHLEFTKAMIQALGKSVLA
jgi:hypothetical protein